MDHRLAYRAKRRHKMARVTSIADVRLQWCAVNPDGIPRLLTLLRSTSHSADVANPYASSECCGNL